MLEFNTQARINQIILNEKDNLIAPIPNNNKTDIVIFLSQTKNDTPLPDKLYSLIKDVSELSLKYHMAFNKFYNEKNSQTDRFDNISNIQNAEKDFHTANNTLSQAITLVEEYKCEVEEPEEILPPLHFNFMDSHEGSRSTEQQLKVIDLHINNLHLEKKRLSNALESDNAIICYAYKMNSPTALYIGDTVYTKYGDEGLVIAVDNDDDSFTMLTDKNEEKSFCGSRLSSIIKYSKNIT
jgi:hypothetical protein